MTVNTAPSHFDQEQHQTMNIVRPGEFLNLLELGLLVKKLLRR
jgi:hypothetical protein